MRPWGEVPSEHQNMGVLEDVVEGPRAEPIGPLVVGLQYELLSIVEDGADGVRLVGSGHVRAR